MARKIKKKKIKEEKMEPTVMDQATALQTIFADVIRYELIREKSGPALDPSLGLTMEEREKIIDDIKADIDAQIASPGMLEEIGEGFMAPVVGVPLYPHWESAVISLPAINWVMFLENVIYPYWEKLELFKSNPTDTGTKMLLKLSLTDETIRYRVALFKRTLEKWDATPIDTKKFILLLIKIKNAIKRTKKFWKLETEIEVTVGKGKKKKTIKKIDKNYLCPKHMTRLTKAENIIKEILGRIPICSLNDEILDELDFEVIRYLSNESNKEIRKMEKRGESIDDTNKIYEVLDVTFLNDCVSIYALPGYLEKKFSNEIKKCEFKKFGTLKKHLAAYSEMITKEVMIVTDEEIRILNERNKTKS